MTFRPSYRASAPVRIDLAGAWTDVSPFADLHGGVVVNAAIDLRASATITPGGDGYRLRADDLGERVVLSGANALADDGELTLLKAALRASRVGPCELRTLAQAPGGSGLGSSGALGVALVAATDLARGRTRSASEVAEAAWEMETREASIAGGKQDQYAAALGGFNLLTIDGSGTRADRLDIDPEFASELARHLVLAHTGKSRFSSNTITRVMQAFERGDADVTEALHALADIGRTMPAALASGSLAEVGALIGANWQQQQRLDADMRTAVMAELESAMSGAGSFGGKAAGSGAGGAMFFVVRDPDEARRRARACGATVLPLRWSWQGVESEVVET